MTRLILLAVLLPLGGCAAAGPIALQALAGLASGATIADKVLDIDVSLGQERGGKTPIAKAIAPAP